MTKLFRQTIIRYVDAHGNRVTKGTPGARKVKEKSKKYYMRLKNNRGKWVPVPLSVDKGASEYLASQKIKENELAKAGIIDRFEAYRRIPLAEHIVAWEGSLTAKECTAKHVGMKLSMVNRVINHCGFVFLSDLSASEVETCLAQLRKQPRFSMQTSNHHLSSMKQFTRWLHRNKRHDDDPLIHLCPGNVALDPRHQRREMTGNELAYLLQNTRIGPIRCKLRGTDREMLYCTAAYTGLRASELASLTPESFDFEAGTLTVEAAYSKHRRADTLPIHHDLAARIRPWVESRKASHPLWPGRWAASHDAGKMMKHDLLASRKAWIAEAPEGPPRQACEKSSFLAYVDSVGRFCDFHALRHSFISRLVRSGIAPKTAQALARHSTITLTMDRYSHIELAEATEGMAQMSSIPEYQNDFGCRKVVYAISADRDNAVQNRTEVAGLLTSDVIDVTPEIVPSGTDRDTSARIGQGAIKSTRNRTPSACKTDGKRFNSSL